ncbi:flagellar assembly protein FliH [Devosia pacifica]|uniref:Flagellar assembly protein FliH n=1 Tax=Devosia pacifica TaxID=1335967 RepID=A0A918S8E3_9HYPH|nr:FliH/SctL family protein [Devosia pacifica]GHA28180.1 flagellar assembly protein FliH [Devosia pacifica]
MTQPARFTFDVDMGRRRPEARPAPRGVPEDEVERRIAEARQQAYAEGMKAGEQNAAAMAEQTLASAAATLATDAARASEALDTAIKAHLSSAVELAASVGRKLALHLIARNPTAELEALLAECLTGLDGAPHLVIRCNPELADAMREKAEQHIRSAGFAGRLIVMGDPEIRIGDGRLEWVDGGLVRDISQVSGAIDASIRNYLQASQAVQNEEQEP